MTEFAKACSRWTDKILSSLAIGLLNRKLYKAVDVTTARGPNIADFQERAKQIASFRTGIPVEFCFGVDSPSDTAYKLYDPDSDKPATQIYVASAGGKQQEISRISENVKNLTNPYTLYCYYFPESVRDEIESNAVPLLFKE